MHAVNSGLAALRHLWISKRGHPEQLFMEMSRLGGALCTFALDSHPRTLPIYDHRNLGDCFASLDEHIRTHLETIVPTNCVEIPLTKMADYFYEGDVNDSRMLGRARWVLGIHARMGEAEVIERVPQLVKLCSSKFVGELVKRAMAGLALTHLPAPPPAIPARVETQYFGVSRDGPFWDHIVQTLRRVGIYVPGEVTDAELELLVILDSKLGITKQRTTAMTPSNAAATPSTRTDNLALIFQEVLTAIVRLRSNRQELSDAESFRFYMREAIKSAIQEARAHGGYNADDIKMATLALTGFLDESVLNPAQSDVRRLAAQAVAGGTLRHSHGRRNLLPQSGTTDGPQRFGRSRRPAGSPLSLPPAGVRRPLQHRWKRRTAVHHQRLRRPYQVEFAALPMTRSWRCSPNPEIVKVTEDPWVKKFLIIAD